MRRLRQHDEIKHVSLNDEVDHEWLGFAVKLEIKSKMKAELRRTMKMKL